MLLQHSLSLYNFIFFPLKTIIFMLHETMKSTPMILFSILLVAQLLGASPDGVVWTRLCHHHHRQHNRLTKQYQVRISWCKHFLQGGRHQLLPPLPPDAPPEQDVEINPRYKASKRFVPTGPNPLHN
jgi:hypothetical protein